MESIKEDLLKCIYSYFDLKENCKYLIYFTTTKQQQQQQDLTCSCTNGINVWNINLTNDIFSSNDKKTTTTLNEHLINLNLKLKRNDYELNKIIDTQNLINLIENREMIITHLIDITHKILQYLSINQLM